MNRHNKPIHGYGYKGRILEREEETTETHNEAFRKFFSLYGTILDENKINMVQIEKWVKENPENTPWYMSILTVMDELYKIKGFGRNIESIKINRIFPYGIDTMNNNMPVTIPEAYRVIGNDRLAYNFMITATNRHFWFLLTLEERVELYTWLREHLDFRLFHVSKPNYTASNMLEDLRHYQFDEDSIVSDVLIMNDTRFINAHKKEVFEPDDDIMRRSLNPYRPVTWPKAEGHIEYKEIDTNKINRIHLGQYIINTVTPRGTVGY